MLLPKKQFNVIDTVDQAKPQVARGGRLLPVSVFVHI